MIYGNISTSDEISGELREVKWADKSFIYEQLTMSNVWIVKHNLHKFPSVTLVDTNGEVFVADVKHLDLNTVQITLSEPMTGRVYFN